MKLRIKVKSKDCWLIAKVKIPSDFVINTNQYDHLSKNYNYGFMKLKNAKRNRLEFVGPKGISLCEKLKKPISEYDFFFIIEQLVDIIRKLQKIGLSRYNLVLDLNYVFFNEATKELTFIYLPIVTPHTGNNILSFVEQILYSASPAENHSNYLSDFSFFIKQFNEFDADKIEKYINENSSVVVQIMRKGDLENNDVKVNSVDCVKDKDNQVASEDEVTDIMSDTEKTDLMDEKTEVFIENFSRKVSEKKQRNDFIIGVEETCLLDDDVTAILEEDDEKTELFEEKQSVSPIYPTLIRSLTEEIIKINKPVFRIGKEENCVDYIVTNNPAISRSHADIISREGKYFVYDLRSKNKSYVNNRVLPTEHEVEIFNGDVLKLANEEFLFQI